VFSVPYLLNKPYANLGSKVGFIYGSVAAVSLIFAYFFVPDCKGRSLEEIDELFASGIPNRKFHEYQLESEEDLKGQPVEVHVRGMKEDTEP
jgi:MFS transporter, SP family, sugar:H+ symporter